MRDLKKIVIHCSDSDHKDHDDISVVDSWHRQKGWKMVGYHFFIKKDGTVQEGRPIGMVGAHVEGHNRDSIGICLSGKTNFTGHQFLAASDLVDRLRVTHGIRLSAIYAHRDLDKHGKTCPNFDINFLKEQKG